MPDPSGPTGSATKPKLPRLIWQVARVAIALALVAVLLARTDLRKAAELVGSGHVGYLVLAAAALLLVFGASTVRWMILLGSRGYRFSFIYLLRVYLSSVALNSVLPTALGGDVLRMAYTTREPRPADAVSIVVVDRAVALVALLGMSLAASLMLLARSGRVELAWLSAAALAALALGSALVFVDAGYSILARVLGRVKLFRLGERLLGVLEGIRSFRSCGAALAWTFVLSLFVRVVYCLAWYLLGMTVGAATPFVYYLLNVQLVSVLTMVPLSIGGVGIRENAFAILMAQAGMAQEQGTTIALLFLVLNYLFALVGGTLLVWLRRARDAGGPVIPGAAGSP